MSPFTGRKNGKAWNKTREKYLPEERRQNLAERDRGSYCNQEEWLEEFLDDKRVFYNGFESDDNDYDGENYNENVGAVIRRCSSKQMLLKISQILQETLVLEFLFNKVAGEPATLLKTDSNIGVRTPFLQNISGGYFWK